jgi:hypothetical protein
MAWPRLPAVAELAIIGAGYLGYALVRLTIHADLLRSLLLYVSGADAVQVA